MAMAKPETKSNEVLVGMNRIDKIEFNSSLNPVPKYNKF